MATFSDLPFDIFLYKICSKISLKDLLHLDETCKPFHSKINTDRFWNIYTRVNFEKRKKPKTGKSKFIKFYKKLHSTPYPIRDVSVKYQRVHPSCYTQHANLWNIIRTFSEHVYTHLLFDLENGYKPGITIGQLFNDYEYKLNFFQEKHNFFIRILLSNRSDTYPNKMECLDKIMTLFPNQCKTSLAATFSFKKRDKRWTSYAISRAIWDRCIPLNLLQMIIEKFPILMKQIFMEKDNDCGGWNIVRMRFKYTKHCADKCDCLEYLTILEKLFDHTTMSDFFLNSGGYPTFANIFQAHKGLHFDKQAMIVKKYWKAIERSFDEKKDKMINKSIAPSYIAFCGFLHLLQQQGEYS